MSFITIDDNLRTMNIPSDIALLGVESDDDVNKIAFKMPKTYCGYDLSTFVAHINYVNAEGEGDQYIVDDLAADGEDPTLLDFTWLVGRSACKYKGRTQFIVCLKKYASDGSGNVLQEFNTTVYSLPVLRGLETTAAVIQQNPDIIEYILQRIEQSGSFDPSQYYTKAETNELIPTVLPNPEALTINGTDYDGTEAVELTIEATNTYTGEVNGKIIHVVDALAQAATDFNLYDGNGDPVASADIAITNKNLFRSDLLSNSVTSKGVTFTKNEDGSVTANGTSTGTNAISSCTPDIYQFVVGQNYTLSSGKNSGNAAVQLAFVFADDSTLTVIAKNSAKTFTISKVVASVMASIVVPDSGVACSNEVVYPQLEVGDMASTYIANSYETMTFDGTTMPDIPDTIANIYALDASVEDIMMEYEGDLIRSKANAYAKEMQLTSENLAYNVARQSAGDVIEEDNFSGLDTTSKNLIGAINELYHTTPGSSFILTTTVQPNTGGITLWDNRITANSRFYPYASDFGVVITNMVSEAGYLSVYFDVESFDSEFTFEVEVS